EFRQLVPMFEETEHLAAVLRNKRNERGAIDFAFKESQAIVDETVHPSEHVIRDRHVGDRLVEELMLPDIETDAEHVTWLDVPFVHRIHENPEEEKLEHVFEFLAGIGYQIKGTKESTHPLELQKALSRVKGESEEMVVSKLMLRSMKQAKYDPTSIGHFGL